MVFLQILFKFGCVCFQSYLESFRCALDCLEDKWLGEMGMGCFRGNPEIWAHLEKLGFSRARTFVCWIAGAAKEEPNFQGAFRSLAEQYLLSPTSHFSIRGFPPNVYRYQDYARIYPAFSTKRTALYVLFDGLILPFKCSQNRPTARMSSAIGLSAQSLQPDTVQIH